MHSTENFYLLSSNFQLSSLYRVKLNKTKNMKCTEDDNTLKSFCSLLNLLFLFYLIPLIYHGEVFT